MPELVSLVDRAVALQGEMGLNDRRFSKEVLGVSPSYWSYLKRGERTGRGGAFVRRVLARFPEWAFSLRPDLPTGNTDRQTADTDQPKGG